MEIHCHDACPLSAHIWRLDSKTDRLMDVLLCRPDHYEWIPTNAIARAALAGGAPLTAKWAESEAALTKAGVRAHFLAPEPHLPYQVYTRDLSQTAPDGQVLTTPAMPQRRGECAAVMAFHGAFSRLGTPGVMKGGMTSI